MNALDGPQSALAPAGPEAHDIARTAWMLFGGAALIFVLVMVLVAIAISRRPRWLSSRSTVVVGGFLFPLVVLSALLVDSLLGVQPRLLASVVRPELVVEIVGEQWWWRVAYLDDREQPEFATANEIRVPVGVPVELRLKTADVLHSFWVPPLAGKLDMVPGRTNRFVILADRVGSWRGQCAEYCGAAHAHMALYVIARPASEFEQWRRGQRADASVAAGSHDAGRAVFEANCAVCHTVRGTDATGVRGPDLTHVASRTSIGAGVLPNDFSSFERWISSNQHLKPGNLMPAFDQLTQDELRSVAAYLADLD
ncbi:MAG: c-type cytochrome [Burkholderiaceae bacterium]|nr:c-type cytochrome [Burkholderiaceae bacterium]